MNLKAMLPAGFFAALEAAGMPEAPEEFSVVPRRQVISSAILAEIADFIHVFDQVTGREAWRTAVPREAPAIAQLSAHAIARERRGADLRRTLGAGLKGRLRQSAQDRLIRYQPFADLLLHGSYIPKWRADRTTRLCAGMSGAIVRHHNREELFAASRTSSGSSRLER